LTSLTIWILWLRSRVDAIRNRVQMRATVGLRQRLGIQTSLKKESGPS
jgi:hypothetical protein